MLKSVFVRWVFCVLVFGSHAIAAPIITGFTPIAAAPGEKIQLTGSGFSSGSFVIRFWNGIVVTSGFVNSDTLVTVVVPDGATTGAISIQQGTGDPLYTVDDFTVVGFGPYIMSFSPSYGAVNDTVAITGVHLTNTTGVKFGGVSATQFTPNADGTQISTRVPLGATTGLITVSTLFGTSNSPTAFTVVGAGPYVTGFNPISGDTSTKVQITGLHLTGVTNVTFNGQPGVSLIANSDTLLQVHPPSSVRSGPIAVYGPQGVFVTSSNFYGNPAVSSFSPASGRVNTNVVINGTNFLGASAVFFGSVASSSITIRSNSQLTARVPAGAKTGLIRVVTVAGSAFSATNFIVAPTISGFAPAFGLVGTAVTITGANLNASTPTIRFNGVAASTLNSVTSTQVVALVPAGATTGPISLSTVDGNDTNATRFYLPATVASFSPTNSAPGSRISITGQNFVGANAVLFNGTAATSFVVTNNTSMSAVVPANIVTGPISITTPAGVFASATSFYGAPRIDGFSPNHGPPGTSVTLKGQNFQNSTIQFAGTPAAVVSLNSTQMVATVPNGASTGLLTVTGPAGNSSSTNNFIVQYSSDLATWITNSVNPVTLGSNLVYTIGMLNRGPFGAPNATLTNTLPPNVTLVSASVSPPWSLATNGNRIIATTTNFANAGTSTLTVTVIPEAVGAITASVSITSDNLDSVPGDNTASIVTTVLPLALLSVGALPDAVKISWPGELTNYTLQFLNGFSGLQWTTVTDTPSVSGGLQFIIQTNAESPRFYRLRR
jgi:large repetitive protein